MTSVRISRRAANYSKHELDCLLTYLEVNPDLVSQKIGGQYETPNDIRVAWDDLSDKIGAIGGYFGTRRSGQEVKRKWSDLKSRVKAKAASLAIEADRPEGGPSLRLTPMEERVLAIISRDIEDQAERSDSSARGAAPHSVKVYSYHNESNSGTEFELVDAEGQMGNFNNDSEILEEYDPSDPPLYPTKPEYAKNRNVWCSTNILTEEKLGIKLSGNEDKKRRISEAFSADRKSLTFKKLKMTSEEEQLQDLCQSQQELNNELRSMKEVLKKCQLSIEKIALLKRAELRLKCAKYGVDFGDLFD